MPNLDDTTNPHSPGTQLQAEDGVFNRAGYECTVVEDMHQLSPTNQVALSTHAWLVTAETLEALYEKLAQIKLRVTQERERGNERTLVSFSDIRKTVVLSVEEVDETRIMSTSSWQTYLKKKAARTEAEERAELARLKAKYGNDA